MQNENCVNYKRYELSFLAKIIKVVFDFIELSGGSKREEHFLQIKTWKTPLASII